MKLLVRTVGEWRRVQSPDWLFNGFVAVVVVGVEALGRGSGTDLHDLLAVFTLAMFGVLVGLRHRSRPLAWVSALGRAASRVGTALRGWTFEIGLDLRGEPRVRRGSPPVVLALAAGLAAWAALAAAFAGRLPHDLRATLVSAVYLAYLG